MRDATTPTLTLRNSRQYLSRKRPQSVVLCCCGTIGNTSGSAFKWNDFLAAFGYFSFHSCCKNCRSCGRPASLLLLLPRESRTMIHGVFDGFLSMSISQSSGTSLASATIGCDQLVARFTVLRSLTTNYGNKPMYVSALRNYDEVSIEHVDFLSPPLHSAVNSLGSSANHAMLWP